MENVDRFKKGTSWLWLCDVCDLSLNKNWSEKRLTGEGDTGHLWSTMHEGDRDTPQIRFHCAVELSEAQIRPS